MKLIIVESPAKAKKIQTFLGKEYIVLASYGHIRNLQKSDKAIDVDSLKMTFELLSDKKNVVKNLTSAKKKCDEVIIATDEDREGEAIGYHLIKYLNLDIKTTKRIIFNEITKNAIIKAIENPITLRINYVHSQFARMAIDHIVGFRLSPLLWENINGPMGLSAGRVQSLIVKLIIDCEDKIKNFKERSYYKISGIFNENIKANIKEEIEDYLNILKLSIDAKFYISNINNKEVDNKPPPPYTTSTMQQDISRIMNLTSKQIMDIAQDLYENGYITYHRTDSVNLSLNFIKETKSFLINKYGNDYSKTKQFSSNNNSQEAHEAIRPTKVNVTEHPDNFKNRFYQLIWKRAVASQMSNQKINRIQIEIANDKYKNLFISTADEILFLGYKILYNENIDNTLANLYKNFKVNDILKYNYIKAEQTFTNSPEEYTESSLIKTLEKKNIGRPSTYASIIDKIQKKNYVKKNTIKMDEKDVTNYILKDKIYEEKTKLKIPDRKNRFISTRLGQEVNNYLVDNFKDIIMNYEFTSKLENDLEQIFDGKIIWKDIIRNFNKDFLLIYNKLKMNSTKKKFDDNSRNIGKYPNTNLDVIVRNGKFGPIAQVGPKEEKKFINLKDQDISKITLEEVLKIEKKLKGKHIGKHPDGRNIYLRYAKYGPVAQIGENNNVAYIKLSDNEMKNITLEEVLKKAEYPKNLGEYKGNNIILMEGRYGFCIKYNGEFYSLYGNEKDNVDKIDLNKGVQIIERKKNFKPVKILMKGRCEVFEYPEYYKIRYVKENGQEKNKNVSKKFMNIDEINDDFIERM